MNVINTGVLAAGFIVMIGMFIDHIILVRRVRRLETRVTQLEKHEL